jgi:hypothetical protein
MAQQLNLDNSQRLDITCKRGDDFVLQLNLKDENDAVIDLQDVSTNGNLKMEVRTTDTYDIVAGTSEDTNIILSTVSEATTSDELPRGIDPTSVDASTGDYKLSVPAADMKVVPSGLYVYDIQMTNNSTVQTILYGIFKVNEDVTVA